MDPSYAIATVPPIIPREVVGSIDRRGLLGRHRREAAEQLPLTAARMSQVMA